MKSIRSNVTMQQKNAKNKRESHRMSGEKCACFNVSYTNSRKC